MGDDIAESRRKYISLKNQYREKGFEILTVDDNNIKELDKWLFEAVSLFSQKKVFFGENLLSKKENRAFLEKYDNKQKDTNIIIWEGNLDQRSVKSYFKNAQILVSRLPYNLFKFLDSVYPSNLHTAIAYFEKIVDIVDENIILFMLQRRVRDLILIKNGLASKRKLAVWQISKLKNQARNWKPEQLISFYDSLFRIEVSSKTSQNYYSIKKSLDIIFCFFI